MTSEWRTTDLGLCASLTASGFVVSEIDKSNPRRAVFVFEDTPELQEKVALFWANELKLPANVLLEHIRLLKSRIYGES
jgi:hypothetical protein